MEHRHGILYCGFSCNALYGLYHYFLGLGVGVKLCLVHYFVHIACRICACFVLKTFHESVLSLLCAQSGKFLQFLAFLALHLLKFLLLDAEEFLLVVNAQLVLLHFLLATAEFFLTLIERYFALFESVLTLLDLLVAHLHFLFKFRFLVEEFLLHFKEFLLFHHLGFLVGCRYHFVIFSLYDIKENGIAANASHQESYDGRYCITNHFKYLI